MKIKKLFIFNFLAIILVILTGELIAFAIEFNVLLQEKAYTISDAFNYYKRIITTYNLQPYSISDLRKPVILNEINKNIILLGCSYTYGYKLNDEETFQYKLAKEINMNVFNLAVSSTGLREMLHILRNKEVLKELFLNRHEIIGGG